MNTSDLSIKELAVFIGVSTNTIGRAVRKGEIPATRVGMAYRLDVRHVRHQMERNAVVRLQRGIGERAGRREPTARRAERPRIGNTGAWLTS